MNRYWVNWQKPGYSLKKLSRNFFWTGEVYRNYFVISFGYTYKNIIFVV